MSITGGLFYLCLFSLFSFTLKGQSVEGVGKGLYVKDCAIETFYRIHLEYNFITMQYDTIVTPYDSLVCSLVPISGLYNLTYCDSIEHLLSVTIDSTYVETRSDIVNGQPVPRDIYVYDTVRQYAYEVHCYKVDTTYLYDTATQTYVVQRIDTVYSRDALRVVGPEVHTATTMTFCPHVESVYYPYAESVERYQDSIDALNKELEQLLAVWPEGIRDDVPLEEVLQKIIDGMVAACPDITVDTLAIRDSLSAIIPQTPARYRARIEAFRQAMLRHPADYQAIQEYHIDSVDVVARMTLKSGAVMVDTFTVRTIPLYYTALKDTSVQVDREVVLWSGVPDLPAPFSGKYVEITYGEPLDAATGKPVKPNKGFSPDKLQLWGDKSLTDSVHIRPLLAEGGINRFSAFGPVYTADTLDGDSLLFPIHIRATQANADRFPHAPEELCVWEDTIKVRIVEGFKLNGYVSYAGLWKPSEIGDTRSPDAPQYDGDLVQSGKVQHLPIANVTVYLKDAVSGSVVDSTLSDEEGYYAFPRYYMPGKYVVTGSSPQKESVYGQIGLNGNDATWVQNYASNKLTTSTLPENTNPVLSMWWWASNVNMSSTPLLTKGLDGNDATAIQNKVAQKLGYGNKYSILNTTTVLDDWAYSVDTIDLQADTLHHLRGVMRGDADRNYNDLEASSQLRKSGGRSTRLAFDRMGSISASVADRIIDYPLISQDSGHLAGFQIFLYFQPERLEPLSVKLPRRIDNPETNLEYNVVGDQILTTWVSKADPYFHAGDTLLMLRLKLSGKPSKKLSTYFKNNALQYVVSDTSARIVPWRVAMPELDLYAPAPSDTSRWRPTVEEGDTIYDIPENETPLVSFGDPEEEPSHILNVIPNPISTWGDVTYFVSQHCLVNLKLYSLLGENVLTFVDGERQQGLYRLSMNMQSLPSGIYVLRLETTRFGETEFDIAKIIIKR